MEGSNALPEAPRASFGMKKAAALKLDAADWPPDSAKLWETKVGLSFWMHRCS